MKKLVFAGFLAWTMLFTAAGTFAQEATSDSWSYGLETSFGLTSGYGIPSSYSASLRGVVKDSISGLSLDWIQRNTKSGLLGSLFLGLPLIGGFMGPYLGGGLGVGFEGGDISFAWKADAGLMAKLFNDFWHVNAGVMYDNLRGEFSITVGVGLKLYKHVTSTYRYADGSTFPRTWTRFFWQTNTTPGAVYNDVFASSEVVNRYRKTTSSSSYTPSRYEMKTSGGETVTYKDKYGYTLGTATTKTKTEFVKTEDAKSTTYFYVYDVTVTRNWYTRTWYYKDGSPTTQRVYQDVESAVFLDKYSRTETR
jgi:hypothetical protein